MNGRIKYKSNDFTLAFIVAGSDDNTLIESTMPVSVNGIIINQLIIRFVGV
jgi:hypothetical protein